MGKKNTKGFTLVEVIVVLVILAILAAILIPSMVGWIDEASQKQYVTECRTCVLAAQTRLSENYGTSGSTATLSSTDNYKEVMDLAKMPGTITNITWDAKKTITHLVYKSKDGKTTVVYCSTAGKDGCGNTETYNINGKDPGDMPEVAQQKANTAFAALKASFDSYADVLASWKGTRIDSLAKETPTSSQAGYAKKIYDKLDSTTKSYLADKSWSFQRTNGKWNLYFTTKTYDDKSSANNVKVYEYNMTTKQYRSITNGSVKDGLIQKSTSWTDSWSDTIY